jgi:PAS domain S-box-containing protein
VPSRSRHPELRPLQQLRELRLFERIFQSSGLATIAIDRQGLIRDANQAALDLLGYSADALPGLPSSALLADGQAPLEVRESRGGVWSGDRCLARADGSTLAARCTVSVLRDGAGEAHGLVVVLADARVAHRERARLSSLRKLSESLNSEGDPRGTLKLICREAKALFGVDGVCLMSYDERTDELVGQVAIGLLEEDFQTHRYPLSDPTPGIVQAAVDRRAVIASAAKASSRLRERFKRFGVHAALAVPLLRGKRLLGALSLVVRRPGPCFTGEDAELAGAFAELAAAAIESARLHEARRARRAQLLALAEVNAMLAGSQDREQIFATIAEGAHRLLRVDEVRIWLLDAPNGLLRAAYFYPPVPRRHPPPIALHHSRMGDVLRTVTPWQIADVRTDDRSYPWPYTRALGLRSCLMVPLAAYGRPLGCLSLLTWEPRTFDDDEVELARTLGTQATLAIWNAEQLWEERLALRLEALMQQAEGLGPRDHALLESLVAAAERIVDLAEERGADYAGGD